MQSSRLEDHMKTIGINQSSFARSSFEHRCMNNIKKIYQHAGKCDDQQNFKDIIDAIVVVSLHDALPISMSSDNLENEDWSIPIVSI